MTAPGLSACNCLALRQAARRVTQYYDAVLAPSGINATQFPVLAQLRFAGPAAIGELARALLMDRATLGHNIRPMLAQGWIVQQTGTDRRRRELALTEAGHRAVAAALPLWQAAQNGFEAAFGAQRAAGLRSEALTAARLTPAAPSGTG